MSLTFVHIHICLHIHIRYMNIHLDIHMNMQMSITYSCVVDESLCCLHTHMGWLRLVGSSKL